MKLLPAIAITAFVCSFAYSVNANASTNPDYLFVCVSDLHDKPALWRFYNGAIYTPSLGMWFRDGDSSLDIEERKIFNLNYKVFTLTYKSPQDFAAGGSYTHRTVTMSNNANGNEYGVYFDDTGNIIDTWRERYSHCTVTHSYVNK